MWCAGWQGGPGGGRDPGGGSLGCRGHQLALISEDNHSQGPASWEVGHSEMFAKGGGPRPVNEEGRQRHEEAGPAWGEGRACTGGALRLYREPGASLLQSQVLGHLQGEGSGGQGPSGLVVGLVRCRVPRVPCPDPPCPFLPCCAPRRPTCVDATGWMPPRAPVPLASVWEALAGCA